MIHTVVKQKILWEKNKIRFGVVRVILAIELAFFRH